MSQTIQPPRPNPPQHTGNGQPPVQQPPVQQPVDQAPRRARRRPQGPRKAPVAKPAFLVIQVLDEHGQPTEFQKTRLKIIAVERSAEKVLEMTETGEHQNSFFMRIMVPAERVQRSQSTEPAA